MIFSDHLYASGNQLIDVVVEKLSTSPANPVAGRIYYDTTENKLKFYNGTAWVAGSEYSASSLANDINGTQYKIYDSTSNSTFNFRAVKSNSSKIELSLVNGVIGIDANITKNNVGLDNVDNTSDLNKPVSTATQTALDSKANKANIPTVVSNVVDSSVASSVKLTVTKTTTVSGDSVTGDVILPISSSDHHGVMAKETYTSLQNALTDIETIKGLGHYIGQTFATKGALNTWVNNNQTTDPPSTNDFTYVSEDETHNGVAALYVFNRLNANTLTVSFAYPISHALATNSVAGIVKGDSVIAGKVFVETDGSMSLLGYDNINNRISDLETGVGKSVVIEGTCSTGATVAAKVITISDYTLTSGDIIAITYTFGNTANNATLNINSTGAKQIWLGGQQPTGVPNTGNHYIIANGKVLYYYDGTYYHLFGSIDNFDNNVDTVNIVHSIPSIYKISSSSIVSSSSSLYNPFIGKCDDVTVETLTSCTTSSTASGARTFTDHSILLYHNILWYKGAVAWGLGNNLGTQLFKQYRLGTVVWKCSIGEYYNKSGVLTGNNITTDLSQAPLYLGGTPSSDGQTFVPSEFSITLRDTSKAYKLIGYFSTEGDFFLTDYQPVYFYKNGVWGINTGDGSGSGVNQYVTTVSSGQSIIIPASTHGCGLSPIVVTYYNGSQVLGTVLVDGSGNITVSWIITLQHPMKIVVIG